AAWRHPAFARLEIVDSWSCYYEMTPDDHPIVGAVPGVAGLYIAAGFSGHGFMHAPATAQLVVEEMLDGRARSIDIRDLSLERFRDSFSPARSMAVRSRDSISATRRPPSSASTSAAGASCSVRARGRRASSLRVARTRSCWEAS